MLYLTISLACDIVAYKQVSIGRMVTIGASFIFPLMYALSDILTEIFGEKPARIVILIQFGCDFIFTNLILLIIHLPSPSSWHLQEAYNQVLNPMFRLYMAGIVGSLSSSLINIHFLSKWKMLMKGKFFWLRSTCATCIGILCYTIVTDLIAFSSTFNASTLLQFTSLNTLSNIAFIVFYTAPSAFIVKLLKMKLNSDPHENTSFNPFRT